MLGPCGSVISCIQAISLEGQANCLHLERRCLLLGFEGLIRVEGLGLRAEGLIWKLS